MLYKSKAVLQIFVPSTCFPGAFILTGTDCELKNKNWKFSVLLWYHVAFSKWNLVGFWIRLLSKESDAFKLQPWSQGVYPGATGFGKKGRVFVTFDTQTSWQVTFLFIPLYNAERSAFRLPAFHSMAFQANISLQTLEFSEVELKSLTFHSPFLLAHLLSYAFPLITKKHICSLCHKHCKKH